MFGAGSYFDDENRGADHGTEGKVYDCKTVWLSNDDVDLAKKLITEALKGRRDIKIKEAKAKYQKAINALNRADF